MKQMVLVLAFTVATSPALAALSPGLAAAEDTCRQAALRQDFHHTTLEPPTRFHADAAGILQVALPVRRFFGTPAGFFLCRFENGHLMEARIMTLGSGPRF